MTQPLAGRTILVTRPAHQAGPLAQAIDAAGGSSWLFPALAIEAVPDAELAAPLGHLADAQAVIFISPNAARFGMDAIRAAGGLPPAARVYAVGPGTTQTLAERGVNAVFPEGQDSEALLALPQLQDVQGDTVVIVRGVGGRALLADTLSERGARVHFLECYRRVCPHADAAPLLERWHAGGIDAVTVASAETLQNLRQILGAPGDALLARTPLFAPHEKIAAAARATGIDTAVATAGGDAGLVAGLINWFGKAP